MLQKRKPRMVNSEAITLMTLFHSGSFRNMKHFYLHYVQKHLQLKVKIMLRKRSVIETINDELKNMCQVEHFRHRSLEILSPICFPV